MNKNSSKAKKVEEVKPNTVKAAFYFCDEPLADLINKVMSFKNLGVGHYFGSKSAMISNIKKTTGITTKVTSIDKDLGEVLINSRDKDGITKVTCIFNRPVPKKEVTKKFNLMILYKEDALDMFIPLVVRTFPPLDYTDIRIRSAQIDVMHCTVDDEIVKTLKEAEYVKSSVS